ncbi:unnamed protein product [Pleuronectes platessa]|uniref:Uncharacterized protein n=1 Tax=Pleuronectes platessa TaxID=8262 RepID=A0A9N7UDI2_PLEPL|nr:unnamed protein product [Pleuronectes platessa]
MAITEKIAQFIVLDDQPLSVVSQCSTWRVKAPEGGRHGEGEAASAAPIRGPSAGDWACCPPLAPQAHSSSTFLRLAPDDASLPASPPPPLPVCLASLPFPPELVAPWGVRGE